ncbi:hypothetical protein NFI96_028473 [Prochilodus magdalenae]|nr:hypothetical protein NFI96_028473 [Prochilodus magdalenae]
MASHEKVSGLLTEYKMDHRRRGLALIFNQENFESQDSRPGTAKDKAKLTERFEELGFRVEHHDDSNAHKMMDILRKATEDDHSDADCFVCVFLSHGEDGHIWARDDKVNIKEITNLFRGDACEKLVGKPKIFIFQTCRGKDKENAVTPMVGGDDDTSIEVEEDAANIYTLPAGADFLMCYCAAEGFVSFRHIENGTFYIQDLCETLKEQGSTLEFTKLLTLVNFKVSKRTAHVNKKQMPCFTSMLTKELYFRPKQK